MTQERDRGSESALTRQAWDEYKEAIKRIECPKERCGELLNAIKLLFNGVHYRPEFCVLPSLLDLQKEEIKTGVFDFQNEIAVTDKRRVR